MNGTQKEIMANMI
jgi:hypothetical protein